MCWVHRPDGIVGRAYAEAMEILDAWNGQPDHQHIDLWVWPRVSLATSIANALLAARGYDECELLDDAIDENPPTGWTLGDLDAELERTRRR